MKTFKHVSIEIEVDEDCGNPRDEFDNLSVFYCLKNSRRITGGKSDQEFNTLRYLEEEISDLRKAGAFIKEFGDNCYAVIERSQVLSEWGVKRISPKIKAIILNNLDGEINTWESWCNGECYGFIITKDSPDGEKTDEHLDSCWGYYGRKDAEEAAEESAQYQNDTIKEELNEIEERLLSLCDKISDRL